MGDQEHYHYSVIFKNNFVNSLNIDLQQNSDHPDLNM